MHFKEKTPITFGTSCMNRLEDLKKTYIKNIELATRVYPYSKFVLLNWNSKDNLENWVQNNLRKYINKKIVKYIRNKDAEEFSQAKTKNTTMRCASYGVVVNLDADNLMSEAYIHNLIKIFKNQPNPVVQCRGGPMAGRIACWKQSLLKIKGFNEQMIGWGYEDRDFVNRFKLFFKDSTYHELKGCCGNTLGKDPLTGKKAASCNRNKNISEQNIKNNNLIANNRALKWGIWSE